MEGDERFVHDVRSAETLQRLDSMLAIVVHCNGISFLGGAHAQPLPPRFAEEVVQEGRRMCRGRTRPASRAKLRDPDVQLGLLTAWNVVAEDMLHQPAPTLTDTDVGPFVLTRDDFALLGRRDDVARRLASMPGVEEPQQEGDETVFAVTKPGNAAHRSPRARPQLDTLLKEIEQSEARLPERQRIDLGWLREARGIAPR